MMKKNKYIILILFFVQTLSVVGQSKYELTKIEFVGNTALTSDELAKVIISKESPNWFLKFLNKFTAIGGKPLYFDSTLIAGDLAALKSIFTANGYFKARYVPSYILDEESETASLRYFIDERGAAKLNSFVVNGLKMIAPEFQALINDYISFEEDTKYTDALVESKRNYILSYLRDHGFMLITADKPVVTVDTLKDIADVVINFNPATRYKISDIQTSRTGKGAELVDDDLLKQIVGIQPESWYSYYDIQRGQVRLYRTNLFTSAIINSVISDTVDNLVPLKISADVGMLYELAPELIINNEDNTFNLGLGANFTRKNFLGNARKATIAASAAAQNISEFIKNPSFRDSTFYGYADARVSIEQPFLFGRLINTKFETYYTFQKRKQEYNSDIIGAKFSLDFELPQKTYFSSFSSYLVLERSKYLFQKEFLFDLATRYIMHNSNFEGEVVDSLAEIIVDQVFGGELKSQSTNTSLGFATGTNKTDNFSFPTEGYTLSLLLEDANSISYLYSKLTSTDFDRPMFIKTVVNASGYLPVYSSPFNSLSGKIKFGQIFTYRGNSSDISLNQRFYAGGSNSVRGWASRELTPKDPDYSGSNPSLEELQALLIEGASEGGLFILEGSIETRNRIIGEIGAAAFIDFGNTWNSYKQFRFNEVAVAAGFGFRYYSEFMPFRLDFGFKIYDPNNTNPFYKKKFWSELLQIHLGIGEAY
jgi:outer membrane protein insertion porin family